MDVFASLSSNKVEIIAGRREKRSALFNAGGQYDRADGKGSEGVQVRHCIATFGFEVGIKNAANLERLTAAKMRR